MPEVRTVYFVDADERTREVAHGIANVMHLRFESFIRSTSFLDAYQNGSGCLIAEFLLEDMSGIELQQRLQQRRSTLPVIFIVAHPETHLIVRAMQHGAITVLEKPISKHELWDGVATALRRNNEMRRVATVEKRLAQLDANEKQVLELILAGCKNKTIAKRLRISLRTVESRRQRLFGITQTGTVAELVQLVMQAQWRSRDV